MLVWPDASTRFVAKIRLRLGSGSGLGLGLGIGVGLGLGLLGLEEVPLVPEVLARAEAGDLDHKLDEVDSREDVAQHVDRLAELRERLRHMSVEG